MRNFFKKNKQGVPSVKKNIFGNVNKEIYGNGNNVKVGVGIKKNKFAIICGWLISVSLFMLSFGIPLFYTGFAFQGIVFEKQMFFYFWVLLALVAWVSKGVIEGEMKIRKTPLDIPILIFWAVYGVSIFFSVDKWHSFWGFFGDPSRGFVSLTASIIVYYLIVSNYSQKRMNWMLGGLIASSIIISVWSLILFFNIKILPDKITAYLPFSFIGTVIGLKIFSGMMIPILMIASFKLSANKSKFLKFVGYVLPVFILGNLVILSAYYQRTVAFVVLFGVGFFLLYILAKIIHSEKNMTWLPMLVFVLMTIVLIIGNNNFARVNPPLEIHLSAKTSWEVAKNTLKEHLFLGTGPATYGFGFSKYRPESFNDNLFFDARFYQGSGMFFEFLSTVGLLGTIAFAMVVITFVNVAIYLIGRDRQKDKIYSLGLLSATLIALGGILLLRMEGTILLLTAILSALSIVTILRESRVEEKYINLSLKASPKFALTLAFVFIVVSAGVATLFVYVGKAYVADVYAGRGTILKYKSNEDYLKDILRAISLNKREGRYYSRAGQEYMLMANSKAVEAKDDQNPNLIKKIKQYLNNSLLYTKEAVNYMPNDALSVSVLAQVNESLSLYTPEALDEALKNYEKLASLEPNSPLPYLQIGQVKMAMAAKEKDKNKRKSLLKEAENNFQKTINKKNNFSSGYFYLSLVRSEMGDRDGAISAMTDAVKSNANAQNNLVYLFNLGRLYQDRDKGGDLDNAQKIFEYILSVNPDDINTNFSLALLYEKKGEKDKAIDYYNKTIELMSKTKKKDKDKIVDYLKKMIENVKNGVSNNDIIKGKQSASESSGNMQEKNNEESAVSDLVKPKEGENTGNKPTGDNAQLKPQNSGNANQQNTEIQNAEQTNNNQ